MVPLVPLRLKTLLALVCLIWMAASQSVFGQQPAGIPPTGYGAPPAGYGGPPATTPTAPPTGYGGPPATGFTPPPTGYGAPPATTGFGAPPTGYGGPPAGTPGAISPSPNWGSPVVTQPTAGLSPGIQPFDPYAMPAGNSGLPPTLGGYPGAPPQTLPQAPAWPYGSNPAAPAATPYGALPPQPYMQNNILPTSIPPYNRLFQDTGFRYTYLYGSKGDELGMNVLELGTSAFFPNFLGSKGPLRVSPGFVFNWLAGPAEPFPLDLPPRVYDTFLDFGWTPQFNQTIGGEVSFRWGLYTDFKSVNNNSVRLTGTGIGIIRITPASSLKLGVTYLDRADIKLLPAIGWLWQPNPQTRWDIYFPKPKLAKYWTTNGNTEIWWYLGGEYGGGSWTAEQGGGGGGSTRFDINDIRVYFGIDWNNLNRYSGVFEVGYVFNREIYYVHAAETLGLNDTFMLRAGLTF